MARPPQRFVAAREIQTYFNEGRYYERARQGEFDTRLLKSRVPKHLHQGEPEGTLSQMVAYYESGRRIAIVHQYLRPDGTLGASGRPDPKQLLHEGELLIVQVPGR
jgi:hypothetical protein